MSINLHHQGGSIGYVGRDYKVNFATTDVVQENQGFAWNPSITGSKSEDTMLATSEGPILLSKPVTFPTLKMQGRRMHPCQAGESLRNRGFVVSVFNAVQYKLIKFVERFFSLVSQSWSKRL